MTAAVWARGALMQEYGVDPAQIRWVTGGLQGPGRRPLVETSIPGVSIEHEDTRGLNDMLHDDAIAAVLASDEPLPVRCQQLVDEANARGGRDNVSVVLIGVADLAA